MEPSTSLQVIPLDQSDPLERGRAYGEAARARIGRILEVYREAFGSRAREDWPGIVARGHTLVPPVERFAPDLLREVEGIAQGAGRSFEEVFLLNARSEILFSAKALGLECTSLMALPEAAAQGETLLAQNWDWMPAARDCQVQLEIAGRSGIPPIVTFTEAGQLAKIGMNGAGIGLVVNNLTSDQPRTGVPWIFITRRILESKSFARALGAILNAPRAHSMNFMIAYATGEGVNLETAPVEEHVIWPEGGLLAHTNHYLQPSLRFRDLKPLWDAQPSTYLRLRRASQGLASHRGRIDAATLQAILKDHMDRPYSVCMHENPELPPMERSATCLSVVMNLTKKAIHHTVGNPCESAYSTVDVRAFLGG